MAAGSTWLRLLKSRSLPNTRSTRLKRHCCLARTQAGANEPGRQVIRLLISPARKITHIHLHFEESAVERTQQYVLQWSPQPDQPCREIVRQQWNFSPRGATAEIEDHHIDLPSVAVLELIIDPDQGNPAAFASLESMRIG
jgi:hypothetical protein